VWEAGVERKRKNVMSCHDMKDGRWKMEDEEVIGSSNPQPKKGLLS
jgi:hypothetical protein